MTRVTRYDVGKVGKVVRRDNGWLTVPATVAKTGVLSYRQKDGSVRRELVLPEELFKADSLESLEGVPVTVEHPATGLLDAKTAKANSVGHVAGKVAPEGDHLGASIMVTDAAGVGEIEAGRREVSAGYTVQLDFTPGVHPTFGAYDAIQKNRNYNHVAITRAGRAGPSVRLHMDSDAVEVDPNLTQERFDAMEKIKINGVEYEVSSQVAQAYAAERVKADSDAAALKASADAEKARADAEKARADAADKARTEAEDPAKIRKAIDARMSLERKAAVVLGADVKLDAMSDRDLMVATVTKAQPALAEKLKSESDAYVTASFDIATAGKPAPSRAVAEARGDAPDLEAARTDAESARKKMLEEFSARATQPIPGAARSS